MNGTVEFQHIEQSKQAQPRQTNQKRKAAIEERKAAIEARLERQRAKLRDAQQALRAIEWAEAKKARKLETRQKIIIGATFMKIFGVTNEAEAQPFFELLVGGQVADKLRERLRADAVAH